MVILAGGSGTRLFPFSRGKYPKQFLKLNDKSSLFQKTIKRSLFVVKPEDLVIITNEDYKFLIQSQLLELSLPNRLFSVVFEPTRRNTAPAIALVVKYVLENFEIGEDEVLFVSPSDHIISPNEKFAEYVKQAEDIAKQGYIVTFGVNPTKPETGYGYIEADLEKPVGKGYRVKRFHEKPDFETAQRYILSGNYYWNSGMFVFSIRTILEEFEKHAPEIFDFIESQTFEGIIANFDEMPDISVDYAVMEKTDKAVVLPMNIMWSDVGSWDSVYEVLDKDENQNVKVGNVVDIDTKNSLIMADKRLVATVGVDNLMVIETPDVVVVVQRGEGQKIKDLVSLLKKNPETKEFTQFHTTVYRPWGSYTELERGERYKIKRITVKPREALSLQLHHHRSEHWVVVKGTAKVVLEDDHGELQEFFVHENESIFVPKSRKHRLINPGKIPLEIIEIQVGEYVEEDDIVRFEDKYERK